MMDHYSCDVLEDPRAGSGYERIIRRHHAEQRLELLFVLAVTLVLALLCALAA